MGAWVNLLQTGAAKAEVEAADPLTLAGTVNIVGAGKHLEVLDLRVETPTELTISTGAITRSQAFHSVDTEGDAGSDDLDTIAGGSDGMFLLIRPADDARSVNVQHNASPAGANNILLSGGVDCLLDDIENMLFLVYDVSLDTNGAWVEISRGIKGVATLSDTTPQAVDGSAGAAGSGPAAARDDHVHALGPLTADLDASQQQIKSFRLETVSAAPDAASEVEGQMYYDTDDDQVKVWVV